MRKLIKSVLGATAALALVTVGVACGSSKNASSPAVQSPAPAAERVNPGAGYFGNAEENVNRPPSTAPTGMGGGPASDAAGSSMGIDQSGGGSMDTPSGTSGTGSTGTGMDMSGSGSTGSTGTGDDMTKEPDSKTKSKEKSKTKPKSDSSGTDSTGDSDKGSGSTGGTMK
jgi:hypothetical protein